MNRKWRRAQSSKGRSSKTQGSKPQNSRTKGSKTKDKVASSPKDDLLPRAAAEAFTDAAEAYQRGNLLGAEQAFRNIVRLAPNHAPSVHNLGFILCQRGRLEEGIELLRRAIELAPDYLDAYFNLGNALQSVGKHPEAEASFRHALRLKPTFAQAYNNLGIVLVNQEYFEAAEQAFRDAVHYKPDYAEAHNNLGSTLRRLGQPDAAEQAFRRALQLNSNYAQAQENLGLLLAEHGRALEAAEAFRNALRVNPSDSKLHSRLGSALLDAGELSDAEAAYRHAVELAPDDAVNHNGLGVALRSQGRFKEAGVAYRRAVDLDAEVAQFHNNLGEALERQGQLNHAETAYRKAVRLEPDFVQAHANLGNALGSQGRTDEQREVYRQALALKPDQADVYRNLGLGYRYSSLDHQDVGQIRRLLKRPETNDQDAMHLHYAMGKIYDDCEEYEPAFEHYQAANEIQQAQMPFDAQATSRYFERLIQTFSQEFLHEQALRGSESECPVFIVGMPRSGTTLVEQVIASHPQAQGAGELRILGELANGLKVRLGIDQDYPECVHDLNSERAASLAADYETRLRDDVHTEIIRVSDKMPFNFYHLGLVALLFPNARVVHCCRDALDTCLSNYFQYFADGARFANQLTDLGIYYHLYERLMAHWRQALPLKLYHIGYEKLVTDTEAEARALINFLDLEWNDACLSFQKTQRNVQTASLWQVRQPVYTRSVRRWRHYEKFLGPLIESLGSN